MKKLFILFTAVSFFAACGEAKSKENDKELCQKECCKDKEHKCPKDCDKPCCNKEEAKHEKCSPDCKKECCKGKEDISQLEIGAMNPSLEVSMKDISGTDYTLKNLAKENGLLVVFSCNTCPFVVGDKDKKSKTDIYNGNYSEGWENRYNDIQKWADQYKIGFVLVNSNEAKREGDDSMDEMKKHAKAKEYKNIKYVVDQHHIVADAFGAKTTPHVFLFNKESKLVYRGAIDDNVHKKEEVKEQWLANAMKNLAEGKEINLAETKNEGCSIKRVAKEEGH